ncbi:MAG: DUF4440 domain-containing protein [Planctomycetes bacterium]|nr:DUF4440 domain-containing protein [Planctomycetota bacterium]
MVGRRIGIVTVFATGLVIGAALPAGERGQESTAARQVGKLLDDWHAAAGRADEGQYFQAFSADGVFLGTDATERWTRDEFRVWAKPHFAKGKAWSFRAVRRAVRVAGDGNVAWFDEDLATEKLGPCRGSGVLVLEDGRWKIAQYVLSVPVPNQAFDDVKKIIAAALEPAKENR